MLTEPTKWFLTTGGFTVLSKAAKTWRIRHDETGVEIDVLQGDTPQEIVTRLIKTAKALTP